MTEKQIVKDSVDITIIITARFDGRLTMHTLNSVKRALERCMEEGLTCELIANLDSPTPETTEFFRAHQTMFGYSINETNFEDVGAARNVAVRKAKGKYVALIDGDDLMSKNWLTDAFKLLEDIKGDIVVHPQYTVTFESMNIIWEKISSVSPLFRFENMIDFNYWDSILITKRDIFIRFPYSITDSRKGFGMEDWHWNCETLAFGIEHHILGNTVGFVRKKRKNSRLLEHHFKKTLPPPSVLFELKTLKRLMEQHSRLNEHEVKQTDTTIHESEERLSAKLIKTSYLALRAIFRITRKYLKPIINMSPRVSKFIFHIRVAFIELFRPKYSLVDESQQSIIQLDEIPEWLISEWKEMNSIEPALFPSKEIAKNLLRYNNPSETTKMAEAYIEIMEALGTGITDILAVPWLKVGGSDLVALHMVRGLKRTGIASRIAIFATEDTDSPHNSDLPEDVVFIDLGQKYKYLTDEQKIKLVARVIIQLKPKRVQSINSLLFHRVFADYGVTLSTFSNLYVHTFCEDFDDEHRMTGFAFNLLNDCYDNISHVLTDNNRIINFVKSLYGYTQDKFVTFYQPSEILLQPRMKKEPLSSMDILWAGRLDRQKHPENLLKIAQLLQGENVHFHIFGQKVLDEYFDVEDFDRFENITFHGPYKGGLKNIPNIENFDLYLHTAEYEGMPNIILEATSLGLPIISSNVGGISELIVDNETGYLVQKFDDIEGYVEKILHVKQNPREAYQLAVKAQENLASEHSLSKYDDNLKSLFNRSSNPKNIAYFVPWAVVGGADMNNINISHGLTERGNHVHFLSTLNSENPWRERLAINAVDFKSVIHNSQNDDYEKYVLEYIAKNNIDIIFISNSALAYDLLPSIKKAFPTINVVDCLTSQERDIDDGGYPAYSKRYDKYIDKRIVISMKLFEYMTGKLTIDPRKIVFIPNGIDTNHFNPDDHTPGKYREKFGIKGDQLLIGYIGRISEEKNPEKVLEIADHLVNKIGMKEVRFIICGGGELLEELRLKVNEMQLFNYIFFTDFLDDIPLLLKDVDLLLITSQMEGQPVTLLEANSMGVPVLASKVGGIPEMIEEGINGYTFNYDENMVKDMAIKIKDLYSDKNQLEKMGHLSRQKTIRERNIDRMITDYVNTITNV